MTEAIPTISRSRLAAYAIFGAGGVAVIALKLGPALLTCLFSYMTLHFAHFLIRRRIHGASARWLSLGVFAVIASGMALTFYHAIRQTLTTLPKIAATVVPRLIETAAGLQIELPFETVNDFQIIMLTAIKDNALALTRVSGLLTVGALLQVGGMMVAVLYFMTEKPQRYGADFVDSVRRELGARVASFLLSFEKVLGAQIIISAVNTVLTAVFLLWCGMPYITFLVPATFILGVIPLVGNVVSNALIVATALTLSLKLAMLALAFLVFIHTLEHFLNSRIVGHSIKAPMWQTLLTILIGDVVMGVPGILLAPAIWHYVREELREISAMELARDSAQDHQVQPAAKAIGA